MENYIYIYKIFQIYWIIPCFRFYHLMSWIECHFDSKWSLCPEAEFINLFFFTFTLSIIPSGQFRLFFARSFLYKELISQLSHLKSESNVFFNKNIFNSTRSHSQAKFYPLAKLCQLWQCMWFWTCKYFSVTISNNDKSSP